MWNEKSFEQMVQEELDIFGRYFDPCIMSYKKIYLRWTPAHSRPKQLQL